MTEKLTTSAEMAHTNEVKHPEPAITCASEKVFTTYELIEHILLALRPSAVPKAAQINKACNSVFNRSENVVKYWMYSPDFHDEVEAKCGFYKPTKQHGAISLDYMSWGSMICYRAEHKTFILLTRVPKLTWSMVMGNEDVPERTRVLLTREELVTRLSPAERESLGVRLDEWQGLEVGSSAEDILEVQQSLSDALCEIFEGKREGVWIQSAAASD